MGSQSKKKPKWETLEVMMEVQFEDDKCTAVRMLCPTLTWKKLGSMGIKIQALADQLFLLMQAEEKLQKISATLHVHMFGDRR